MKINRPVFLNLFQISFPLPAIVSIIHRVSGVALFFFIPMLLWMWEQSTKSQATFDGLLTWMGEGWSCTLVALGFAALVYHAVAGVRHLLMDLGIGEEKSCSRYSAWLVFAVTALVLAIVGVLVWR